MGLDRVGLWLGPLLLIAWVCGLSFDPEVLSPEAHRLAGIMLLVVCWWITEPIPIAATGIFGVVLCVILGAVPGTAGETQAAKTVLAPFADPSAFFLLGGMFIGRAMERHGLDRRFALAILCARWAGRSPATILLGLGLAVTLVSLWISNTAATAMIFPVALGIIHVLAEGTGHDRDGFARSPYATSLLLMTAYASSVGGVATPIGTGTNVLARGLFERPEYLGTSIDFVRWTLLGVPLTALIFLGLCWWLLRFARSANLDMPRLRAYLLEEQARLGPWKRGEWNTLAVFTIVVSLWVTPGLLALLADESTQRWYRGHLSEDVVALLAPVLCFLLPVDWRRREATLSVRDFSRIDWSAILLFGAGLSLGNLMARTGLAHAAAQSLHAVWGAPGLWELTFGAILAGIILSEFTSNAAAVATLFPVIFALTQTGSLDPWPPLLGLTFGASFGSALPVSTPPNAIVYGSGLIPARRMMAAGLGLDLICAVAIWLVLRVGFACGWTPV